MQRAVLEREHQVAFDLVSLLDNLCHLTVANNLPGKRPQEQKAMSHALRKPHCYRRAVCRRAHKTADRDNDRNGCAGSMTVHRDFEIKHSAGLRVHSFRKSATGLSPSTPRRSLLTRLISDSGAVAQLWQ